MQTDGRVVAVNVAVVRTDEWTRSKSGRSGIDKRAAAGPVLLDVEGVAGDTICDTRNHGGPDQAVYAYSVADLTFWAAELDRPVVAGNMGENLTLDGVDCSGAVLGERWRVGAVELVVRGPRIPCSVFSGFLDVPDLIPRFLAAGRPGCYLAVARPGPVQAGDRATVLHRPAHGVTAADVMAVRAGERSGLARLLDARDDMGVRGREWLDKITASAR